MSTPKVLALGHGVGRATIEDWLAARPEISERIVQAGGVVVLFEVEHFAPHLPLAIERGLAAAEASVPANVALPLFVARTSLHEMNEAGMLFGPRRGYMPLSPARGAFVGYFAIGEGGARFIAGGQDPDEEPEQALARFLP